MRKFFFLISGILFLSLYFWAYKSTVISDPDRYFHIAISKLTVDNGSPLKVLPQAEELGWDKKFPNKEYFFHVLSSVAYYFGGEEGVLFLIPLLSLGVILSLAYVLCSILPVSFAIPALLIAALNSFFLYRLWMLRPFVLSILIFIWIIYAVTRRSALWVFFLTFLFALSYHALYLPLIAVGLYCFVFRAQRALSLRLLASVVGGCILGTVLNPIFPDNFIMGLEHIRVALWSGLGTTKVNLSFADEALPAPVSTYLKYFWMQILVMLIATFQLIQWKKSEKRDPAFQSLVYFTLLFCVFFLLALINKRAIEYMVPVSSLFFGQVLFNWTWRPRLTSIAFSVLILGSYLPILYYVKKDAGDDNVLPRRIITAIKRIPLEPKGVKVFNANWADTPYLLYIRPDLRFLDIMDPILLYSANEEKFRFRETFLKGQIADPYALVKNIFGATYLMADDMTVIEQVEADPNFRRVYPINIWNKKDNVPALYIYAVEKNRVPNQVLNFDVGRVPSKGIFNIQELNPKLALDWKRTPSSASVPLVNLLGSNLESSLGTNSCAFLRPSETEIRKHIGAEWMAVGGGEYLRLWLNDKPYYAEFERALFPRTHRSWLPLKKPLQASDRIEILVCSEKDANYLGAALSLWTSLEIEELCKKKNPDIRKPDADLQDWAYSSSIASFCTGSLAVPLGKVPLNPLKVRPVGSSSILAR